MKKEKERKKRKKKPPGREYLNDVMITEASKIRYRRCSWCHSPLSWLPQTAWREDPPAGAPCLPGRLQALHSLSELFGFYALQWHHHFPHPICIFYTCIGECYWKCHLSQSCETTMGNSLYQELQFPQSSNWGAITTFSPTPPSPNFRFTGSFLMLPTISSLWI